MVLQKMSSLHRSNTWSVMGDLSYLGELTTYMMPSTTASSTVKKTHLPVLCCWTSKYAASSPTSSSFWQGINDKLQVLSTNFTA